MASALKWSNTAAEHLKRPASTASAPWLLRSALASVGTEVVSSMPLLAPSVRFTKDCTIRRLPRAHSDDDDASKRTSSFMPTFECCERPGAGSASTMASNDRGCSGPESPCTHPCSRWLAAASAGHCAQSEALRMSVMVW